MPTNASSTCLCLLFFFSSQEKFTALLLDELIRKYSTKYKIQGANQIGLDAMDDTIFHENRICDKIIVNLTLRRRCRSDFFLNGKIAL